MASISNFWLGASDVKYCAVPTEVHRGPKHVGALWGEVGFLDIAELEQHRGAERSCSQGRVLVLEILVDGTPVQEHSILVPAAAAQECYDCETWVAFRKDRVFPAPKIPFGFEFLRVSEAGHADYT